MAFTKVQIISNAITLLGHKPIVTLDEDDRDDLVTSAEQAFDFLLPCALTENTWRFATRITQVSRVNTETPPAKWQGVYLVPSGFLKLVRMHPHTYAYELFENHKLYADFGDGPYFMEHVFQPDISRLPPYFVKFFVFDIAAYLALSNAQKADYYSVLESKRILQLGIAMATDSQNRPQNSQATFPVVQAPNALAPEYTLG